MRGSWFRILIVGLSVLIGSASLFAVAPAHACGCGAYVPKSGDATVATERALLRWDGSTEDIVMSLDVKGRSQEAPGYCPYLRRLP